MIRPDNVKWIDVWLVTNARLRMRNLLVEAGSTFNLDANDLAWQYAPNIDSLVRVGVLRPATDAEIAEALAAFAEAAEPEPTPPAEDEPKEKPKRRGRRKVEDEPNDWASADSGDGTP